MFRIESSLETILYLVTTELPCQCSREFNWHYSDWMVYHLRRIVFHGSLSFSLSLPLTLSPSISSCLSQSLSLSLSLVFSVSETLFLFLPLDSASLCIYLSLFFSLSLFLCLNLLLSYALPVALFLFLSFMMIERKKSRLPTDRRDSMYVILHDTLGSSNTFKTPSAKKTPWVGDVSPSR